MASASQFGEAGAARHAHEGLSSLEKHAEGVKGRDVREKSCVGDWCVTESREGAAAGEAIVQQS